jgi:hypothetical protein
LRAQPQGYGYPTPAPMPAGYVPVPGYGYPVPAGMTPPRTQMDGGANLVQGYGGNPESPHVTNQQSQTPPQQHQQAGYGVYRSNAGAQGRADRSYKPY